MPQTDSAVKKYRTPLILGCVLILLSLSLAVPFWVDTHTLVPEGVSLGGLPLGGLSRREARAALDQGEGALMARTLTLELPREAIALAPEDISLRLDAARGAKEACKAAPGQDLPLSLCLSYDEALVRSGLQCYARKYDSVLTQHQAALSGPLPELREEQYDPSVPCPELVLTLGTPELHLDVEAALVQVRDHYDHAFAGEEDALTVAVVPSQEPEPLDLEAIRAAFSLEAVDASLDMENYVPIPGSYGCGFDLEAAQQAVSQAQPGEQVAIPMAYTAPEILSDAVYFRDELGHCETAHNSNENRNTNLRLLCQILDGHVIQPGEEFSYNGTLGERTPERGFMPAPAYSGNRLIQDYGGGVCQGSTTLYNCVLLADLEVTHRVCHGVKVNYVPLGLDAAVNWNTKTDLSFRNNFHFPVMIRAEVADGYVKMKLMGTDEKDYYVEMESRSGKGEGVTYATSYKCKYDKVTGEQISREVEARSTYYQLD